jgi:hypothetical protein
MTDRHSLIIKNDEVIDFDALENALDEMSANRIEEMD